jgi:hypothetical protein
VEVHHDPGVLEDVAGQHGDDGVPAPDDPLPDEAPGAGHRRRRGRLAADPRRVHDRLRLEGTATFTEPVITEIDAAGGAPFREGDLLSYRPQWIAFVSPVLEVGPFSLSCDYGYASRLEREQVQLYKDDQRVARKQLDARILYNWQNVTTQFAVRNLLQYNYAQTERNMNELRSFSFGLQLEY